MDLLTRAGAWLRARLIPNLDAAWRLWSVRLALLGALLSAAAASAPDTLLTAWQALPDDVRALLPAGIQQWAETVLFTATLLARVLKQRGAGDDR